VFVLNLYAMASSTGRLRAVGYDRNTPNPAGARSSATAPAIRPACLLPGPTHSSLLDARRAEAAVRRAAQLDAALHARAEPPGHHERDRRRRRLPELPQDYEVVTALESRRPVYRTPRGHLLRSDEPGAGRLFERVKRSRPGRRRHVPHQRRGRDAGDSAADFETSSSRGPSWPARMEPDLGAVVRLLAKERWPSGCMRPTMNDHSGARRVRGGRSRVARRHALVPSTTPRPFRAQHRSHPPLGGGIAFQPAWIDRQP